MREQGIFAKIDNPSFNIYIIKQKVIKIKQKKKSILKKKNRDWAASLHIIMPDCKKKGNLFLYEQKGIHLWKRLSKIKAI